MSLWRMTRLQIWMLLQILTHGGFTHSFNPTAHKISTISAALRQTEDQCYRFSVRHLPFCSRVIVLQPEKCFCCTFWIYSVLTLTFHQTHCARVEFWHLISSFLRVRGDEAAQVSLNNIVTTGAVRSTLILRDLLSVCFVFDAARRMWVHDIILRRQKYIEYYRRGQEKEKQCWWCHQHLLEKLRFSTQGSRRRSEMDHL